LGNSRLESQLGLSMDRSVALISRGQGIMGWINHDGVPLRKRRMVEGCRAKLVIPLGYLQRRVESKLTNNQDVNFHLFTITLCRMTLTIHLSSTRTCFGLEDRVS